MNEIHQINNFKDAEAILEKSLNKVDLIATLNGQGAAYYIAMEEKLRELFYSKEFTFIIDCGQSAGSAMAAIRMGASNIMANLEEPTLSKIVSMAENFGTIFRNQAIQ